MSFYFHIPTEQSVSYQALKTKLNQEAVQFNWQPNGPQDAIANTKIYLPGKSTRGISIRKDETGYAIGINVIASEEDFHLAINTTHAIAELTAGDILPEDREEPIAVDELTATYNQAWIDEIKTLGISLFLEKIGDEGSVLTIGCCYMDYMVGPKIHQQLDASSETSYYNSLVKYIQETQFFDQERFPKGQQLITDDRAPQDQVTTAVFKPTGAFFLAKAKYIVFPVGGGRYELPYSIIEKIATDKFYRVDEVQYIVDQLNTQEYANIIQSIETEMGTIPEDVLQEQFSQSSDQELDDEFNRLTAIPNARTKIFVLQRMSVLIGEYDKRGLTMPNKRQHQTTSPPPKQTYTKTAPKRPAAIHEVKNYKEVVDRKEEGPWWKFW